MAKSKKETQEKTIPELLQEMKAKGIEHKIPATDRVVRLRTLDAPALLKEGKMPDILTPLVIKSVYQEVSDREMREFLGQKHTGAEDALKMIEAMDYVVQKSITDGTKPEDLTLGEKRWIFRLAMGPAELLVTFRYDEDADVESVDEGEDLPQTAE